MKIDWLIAILQLSIGFVGLLGVLRLTLMPPKNKYEIIGEEVIKKSDEDIGGKIYEDRPMDSSIDWSKARRINGNPYYKKEK